MSTKFCSPHHSSSPRQILRETIYLDIHFETDLNLSLWKQTIHFSVSLSHDDALPIISLVVNVTTVQKLWGKKVLFRRRKKKKEFNPHSITATVTIKMEIQTFCVPLQLIMMHHHTGYCHHCKKVQHSSSSSATTICRLHRIIG